MWIKRDFEETFHQTQTLPAVLIKGMRQCGKSSFLKRILSPHTQIAYLDHLELRQLAEENPALFFKPGKLASPMEVKKFPFNS
jgi:predicted AAA+ superfamily ATPase